MRSRLIVLVSVLALLLVLGACGETASEAAPTGAPAVAAEPGGLRLASPAFPAGGLIPTEYTCEGQNVSPEVTWSDAPDGTESFALIMEDADSRGFVHWVIYNMPARATGLAAHLPPNSRLQDGSIQGPNDFAVSAGRTFPGGTQVNGLGYDGPCPPAPHVYLFTLYALDSRLRLSREALAVDVRRAVEGHVLAQAELRGRFPG